MVLACDPKVRNGLSWLEEVRRHLWGWRHLGKDAPVEAPVCPGQAWGLCPNTTVRGSRCADRAPDQGLNGSCHGWLGRVSAFSGELEPRGSQRTQEDTTKRKFSFPHVPWPPGSKPRQRDYFTSTKSPVLGRSRLTEEGENAGREMDAPVVTD